jgi:hypothetical protein
MGTGFHEEATMATITFNAAQRAPERLEAVLTAVGEKFDVFVSYQMQQAAAEAEPIRTLPNDELAGTTTPFLPLDAGIVSDAIPAFFIGRNRDGFWVARDAKGRIGGLFVLKASAVSFARLQSGLAGCATIFPTDRFELDLKNSGNPLIPYLRPLMVRALHLRRRAIAGTKQIAAATEHRRKA